MHEPPLSISPLKFYQTELSVRDEEKFQSQGFLTEQEATEAIGRTIPQTPLRLVGFGSAVQPLWRRALFSQIEENNPSKKVLLMSFELSVKKYTQLNHTCTSLISYFNPSHDADVSLTGPATYGFSGGPVLLTRKMRLLGFLVKFKTWNAGYTEFGIHSMLLLL